MRPIVCTLSVAAIIANLPCQGAHGSLVIYGGGVWPNALDSGDIYLPN